MKNISIISMIFLFIANQSICQVDSTNSKVTVEGKASIGGAIQVGNLDLFTVTSSLEGNINYKSLQSTSFVQYTYNKTLNNVLQNDIFAYEILSFKPKKRFYPKVSGMYEKSKVKSINERYILGAGIGWNILNKPKYKLSMINSVAYEKTEFLTNNLLDYQGIRYSVIFKGNYVLLKNKLIIKHNFFIHPLIHNADNNYRYRLLLTSVLPISKKFAVQFTVDYNNESIVDTGFQPENMISTFGLSYKF